MLYEMATGHPAFPGRTTAVIFDKILNKTSAPPGTLNSELPPGLEQIIIRALAKDREQRYQSAADLRSDLERLRRYVPRRGPRPAGPDTGKQPRAFAKRRRIGMAVAAGAVVLLVIGLIAGRGRITPPAASGPIDSIAVLPFVNASGTPDADYLSEGIAGTLTNNLTRVPGLRVVPRTLAARYKNQSVDPVQAGRDLNARAVVTGRVVQRGDRLTIQAELIDVAGVAQLWGDQFERPLADVLNVQAEISRAIADNLRLRLTREDEKGLTAGTPRDAVAYQLYLRGQYATNERTSESYKQATQYFNQAIERDPSYALAYAGLADAYIWQGYWGLHDFPGGLSEGGRGGKTGDRARRALGRRPRLAGLDQPLLRVGLGAERAGTSESACPRSDECDDSLSLW
jgi:TolB-like protein